MAKFRAVAQVMAALFATAHILIPAQGAQATLRWDPSPDSEVVSYNVYGGLSTNTYAIVTTVPATATNAVVPNLLGGTLYYFAVTAVDAYGAESDFSNVVDYNPTSTMPTAVSKTVSTSEDQAVAVALTGTDPESNPLTFQTKLLPTNGTLTGTPPALTYRPNTNFFGADTFTYIAKDASSTSALATVTINVSSVNDVPTLNALSSITVYTNSATRTVNLSGITSGASNESQVLTVTAVSSNPTLISPTVSYASPTSTGTVSFKPALNLTGTATITVTVKDGQTINNSFQRSFVVTVQNPPPPPPVVSNAVVSDIEQTLQVSWTTDQLATCTLEYGTTSSYGSSSAQTSGTSHLTTISNLQPATLYYLRIRAANSAGLVSVTPIGSSTTGPLNRAPAAVSKTVSTAEDQSVAVALTGTDADSDPLTFQTKSLPTNGTLTGTPPALIYRPNTNFLGTDSFTYTASDSSSTSAVATVTINVSAVNDVPTLNALSSITVYTNSATRTVSLSGISSGATNETQVLIVTATSSNPSLISPTVSYTSPSSTGTVSFKPALNLTGTATITVTVKDGQATNNSFSRSFVVTVQMPPPTISGAMEVSNDARTLQISWTTDQIATCTLEYGTNTSYGSSSVQSNGANHLTTISNLQPSTVYYLRVRAANSAGAVTVSFIGTAATEPVSVLEIPAEGGQRSGPFLIVTNSAALDGKYISSSTTGSGQSIYDVTVPTGLNYRLWARVKAPVGGGSFAISFDSGTEMLINVPQNGTANPYRWLLLTNGTSPLVVPLFAGSHQFIVGGGIANTQIDEFILSNDPDWQPILVTTQPSLALNVPATTTVDLSWVANAGNADYVRVESSLNGSTFTSVAVVPATQTSFLLTNLSATSTYYFRVYAYDAVDRTANSNVAVRPPML